MREDFTGYLLLTDYDGTLAWDGIVPEKNRIALEKFMARGGKFGLSTGRRGRDFVSGNPSCPRPNAPVVGLSGSEIYDTVNDKILWTGKMPFDLPVFSEFFNVSKANRMELVYENDSVMAHSVDEIRAAKMEDLCKIVVFTEYYSIQEPICREAIELARDKYNIVSNGYSTFELTAIGVNKGVAANMVKKMVGAHTLICAGDFIGDISMLKIADISYSVPNAHGDVINCAGFMTNSHAKDGAVAEMIERI